MSRPNVLLFIMDDQTPFTLGARGNSHISTPNLDGLMRSGTWLSPYTTVPVCQPARGELLTGRNAFQNGCRWFGEDIKPDCELLPRVLADAGYHCVHIGKWHNDGHPRDRGYHDTRRVFSHDLAEPYTGQELAFLESGQLVRGHSTELFCGAAIDFLRTAPAQQPWFCYCALLSPHDPRTAPESWRRMYTHRPPPLPANFLPEHPFDNGDMLIRDERLAGFPRRPEEIIRHRADYYAMISHHDHWIGQVLRALEERGQRENTLIIFTSDHGLAIGSHGLMGKENLYEHSARVPLIFNGPGISKGVQLDDCLCGHEDLMPTLLDFLGVEIPQGVYGKSYLPVLRGQAKSMRPTLCAAYRDCMRMARDERFKMICYPHLSRTQLFDLKNDPDEINDLLTPWRRHAETRCTSPSLSPTHRIRIPDPAPDHDAPLDNPFGGAHPIFNPRYQPALAASEVDAIVKRLSDSLATWQKANDDPLVSPCNPA